MRRRPVLCLLLVAGCAERRAGPAMDAWAFQTVTEEAARQVRRCYRSPSVPAEGRRIITRLRVYFDADGSLAGLPRIVLQQGVTRENAPYASRMAEAAASAIIRCAPYRLPPDLYKGGWEGLDLVFSPKLLA